MMASEVCLVIDFKFLLQNFVLPRSAFGCIHFVVVRSLLISLLFLLIRSVVMGLLVAVGLLILIR